MKDKIGENLRLISGQDYQRLLDALEKHEKGLTAQQLRNRLNADVPEQLSYTPLKTYAIIGRLVDFGYVTAERSKGRTIYRLNKEENIPSFVKFLLNRKTELVEESGYLGWLPLPEGKSSQELRDEAREEMYARKGERARSRISRAARTGQKSQVNEMGKPTKQKSEPESIEVVRVFLRNKDKEFTYEQLHAELPHYKAQKLKAILYKLTERKSLKVVRKNETYVYSLPYWFGWITLPKDYDTDKALREVRDTGHYRGEQ